MKTVEKIERKLPVLKTRKRVAAYARVSMESERMQHSLSAQVSYYSALIQKNPEWEYAGVFADYGISGTGTKKRDEFNRMLAECEAGNIDIILTKSIQRFARNTVDLLNTVRHLKDLGIEVRFEKENINSLSGDGELMLSILASFAQEESRSISENVKWGTIKRFKQGIPNGKFSIFGYEWQDDKLVIIPEEAEIIRWMYAEYMKGASRIEIGRALMDRGIYTRQGKPWMDSNVKVILTNITYTGNMLFQKEYCEDPITKHRRKNYGELPQYFVEDTHEAIIPMDEWQAVQAEFKRRRDLGPFGNKSLKLSAFSTKITCGCCGKHYRHSGKRNTAGEVYYIWTCQTKSQKGASACPSKNIPEKMLQNTTAEVLGLAEYDEDAFSQQIEEVIVIGDDTLTFRFYDGHEVTTKWQSKGLKAEFRRPEAQSAILNWLLEGYRLLQTEGFMPPQSVVDATNTYYHDSDKIAQFAEDCLVADPGTETRTAEIYDAYRTWCAGNGCCVENNRNFVAELRKFDAGKVIRKRPRSGGEKTTVLMGYALREAVEFLT